MMATLLRVLVLGAALGFSAQAIAQAQKTTIEVEDAWARSPGEGGKRSMAFAEIKNVSDKTDTLIAVSSPWADRVTIEHLVPEGYDMKPRTVPSLSIGPGKKLRLNASEYYFRLDGLNRDIRPDYEIPISLRFQNAGRVEIKAVVRNQKLGNMGEK
jgi:periplasmic copper chaperone A